MTELKPCPFCGGTSLKTMYRETDFIGFDCWNGETKLHRYSVYIRCNKCFSRGKPISFKWVSGRTDSNEKMHEHDKEAIEMWNRRVNNETHN